MSFRSRLSRVLLGDEIKRIERSFALMQEAYAVGPFQLPPEQLVSQLKEVDPWTLQDLVMQIQYDIVGGLGAAGYTDAERIRAVDESMRMFRYDVITEFGIKLWTNFGFGNSVKVIPHDETGREVWSEFWAADRNAAVLGDDAIHSLSESVLSQGELFVIVYASTQDGECTIRLLGNAENPGTKQITQIVALDGDENTPLYYKREWVDTNGQQQTLYYPDWQAFFSGQMDKARLPDGARRAQNDQPGTVAVMLHIAHNRKGSPRGWPLMTAGAPWSRSHKKFREDRATVAAAVAMFVHKIKAKGGQRAVDAVRSRIASSLQTGGLSSVAWDTNPPPAAGSTWIENDAANLERLPMGTGAGDSKEDGDALLRMAGLGVGIYPTWLGVGDTNALATAKSMEQPMARQFSRYQTFWAAQWRKLVKIVLGMAQKYGGQTFEDMSAEVSTDKLIQTDLGGIVTAIAPLIAQTIAAIEKGQVDGTPLASILGDVWALAMDALGVEEIEPVAPTAFGAEPAQTTEGYVEGDHGSGGHAGLLDTNGHVAVEVSSACPLCGCDTALSYAGHGGLLVCSCCGRTYDPIEALPQSVTARASLPAKENEPQPQPNISITPQIYMPDWNTSQPTQTAPSEFVLETLAELKDELRSLAVQRGAFGEDNMRYVTAPAITVTMPEQEPPIVNISPTPAPQTIINMPDNDGLIAAIEALSNGLPALNASDLAIALRDALASLNVKVENVVNVPEQAAPVVNVAAPVVNVAPAQVTLAVANSVARVKRDAAGKITEIDSQSKIQES